jgi:ribosome-associated translation inhibitor RaiA
MSPFGIAYWSEFRNATKLSPRRTESGSLLIRQQAASKESTVMTAPMKLTLQHLSIRPTHALDSWVEKQIVSLQPRLRIDQALVRLVRHRESSPPYRVQIHLVTPGPDVVAEGHDHTLQAAFNKVMAQLRNKITSRLAKQIKRTKGPLAVPSALASKGRFSR